MSRAEGQSIVEFAVLDVDLGAGDAERDFAAAAGRLRGVTTFATTFFPLLSSKSIVTLPSVLLMSREAAGR